MAKAQIINKEAIGTESLSFCEKVRVLSERYRRQGQVFADLIGVSPVTLSRWANGHVGEISREHADILVELGCGLIKESEVVKKPEPKPEPKRKPVVVKAKKPVVAAKKKPAPVVSMFAETEDDDDDMDL
jgi:DNA-binding transcriptional regulator YdaS (Cro superfamily)